MGAKIIVLGGGFGGATAAQKLDKYLLNDDIDITLIEKNDSQTYLTELHEVAGNRIKPEGVKVSLKEALEFTSVKIVQDEIKRVDIENKKIYSDTAEYGYDYLVIACGSEPAYFGIPGMKEHAFTLWSLKDAEIINKHIRNMFKKAQYENNREKRAKMLTFIVGGGGFTGVEMMGELMEWVDRLCKEYKIPRDEVKLTLVEALPKILPTVSREHLVQKVVNFFNKNGVEVKTNSMITSVTPDGITLKSGEEIPTKTLIWTGGIQGNSFVANIGLTTDKKGRIVVNKYMESSNPYIYAIGDSASYVGEDGKPMPALVESALQSADAAAYNICASIKGLPKKELKLNLHGNMVSVGRKFAIAELSGIGGLSGYPATFMKHIVNMHYLFGLSGLGMCAQYIRDQFIDVPDKGKLSIIENHVAVTTNMFWLSLMRVFLGLMWIISGIQHIQEGWLSSVKLSAGASAAPMQNVPAWYGWFMEKFIFPHAIFFQSVITLSEIGIGLLLVAGLFTFIAALGTIFLHINFYLSGMATFNNWWYVITAIAIMGGAGRAFGLDYYVMPWLSKVLKHWVRRKKLKLNVF
ncbi:FAD-dependent oxidoreductase [Thermoanaerobacterium thermosaccharolyticum]|uniref:FAD-dependent oxidoreductase n=1 Tax=Thermoanaerobacterium thermosaccharolyticum TaxID=1517 RepID=UPI001785F778|nr:FAD-dependent oxidoreductase [Thermoanaerobacterium thermosaccharolyticum]MBE0068164.1 DoxX family membrane protein [Thermoanaerobacterium thermosaccharolyticum]MBE0227900.1 DoxX family membrane protein [Thermoanaerobacterium thermosaccharolyticum]